MTDSKNFEIVDRPIEGSKYSEPTGRDQGDSAEFLSALDKLFAVDGIEEVRWTQYTPHFNDGEALIFEVNEVEVKLSERFGVEEDDGEGGDGWLGEYDLYDYVDSNYRNRTYMVNGQSTEEIKAALDAFDLDSFETVVKLNFGDHAQVTATPAGFAVEIYEHD